MPFFRIKKEKSGVVHGGKKESVSDLSLQNKKFKMNRSRRFRSDGVIRWKIKGAREGVKPRSDGVRVRTLLTGQTSRG